MIFLGGFLMSRPKTILKMARSDLEVLGGFLAHEIIG